MPNNDLAISVRGLSKSYTIAHGKEKHTTLAEALVSRIKHPMNRAKTETFWALQDVSFDVAPGEVVGIIGRNGAGKSTLLKILSRITGPTDGAIDVYGRIGSLLEVGTGFHQELTGRENVFLNGAILGMRRSEIARHFDAIVDFAGVEQFIDTPVKRYSSGMYVRLAFAVAAHLAADILIIDEVLAVGDMEFQKKCLGKMKDVASGGRTVLFVSHQMQAITTLCSRAIYLQNGRVCYAGEVPHAIALYMNAPSPSAAEAKTVRRPGSGEMRFENLVCDKATYLSTDPICVEFDVREASRGLPRYFVSFLVINGHGLPILHLDSRLVGMDFRRSEQRKMRMTISNHRLAAGDYTITAYLCSGGGIVDHFERAGGFTISPVLPYPDSSNNFANLAVVYPDLEIETDENVAKPLDAIKSGAI